MRTVEQAIESARNLTQGQYTQHTAEELGVTRSGFSELLMHVRLTERPAHTVFLNERRTYAYVVFRDGSLTDGCWHQFADGTFSLS